MRPLAVIVSGAPGSGKTTLASKLAQYMVLPHIERDRISSGLEYTRGGEHVDRATVSLPLYYGQVADALKSGMSFVTDGTLYKGISEADIRSHIMSHGYVVNVHARASNEHERFYEREMNREGRSSDWVKGHMEVLDRIYDQVVDPLELGIPIIEVNTTDGYEPSIAIIAERISQLFDAHSHH